MTTFLTVTGSGDPESIDAYFYGDNQRLITFADGKRFAAVVIVLTTGGFGAGPQADRLRSGLYGAGEFETFEGAFEAAKVFAQRCGLAKTR